MRATLHWSRLRKKSCLGTIFTLTHFHKQLCQNQYNLVTVHLLKLLITNSIAVSQSFRFICGYMFLKINSLTPFEFYKIEIYHCLPMYRFSRNKFFLWSLTVLLCYYIPVLWHFRDWLPLNLNGLMRVLPRTLLLITWGCLSDFSMF